VITLADQRRRAVFMALITLLHRGQTVQTSCAKVATEPDMGSAENVECVDSLTIRSLITWSVAAAICL
jgi:hypothetical protein